MVFLEETSELRPGGPLEVGHTEGVGGGEQEERRRVFLIEGEGKEVRNSLMPLLGGLKGQYS